MKILHDQDELSSGLPTGQYDVPLSLFARRYNPDGSLWDPEVNKEVYAIAPILLTSHLSYLPLF
jgi:bilirubin oxidase